MQLSVVVITLNEEKNIERCLKAVQGIADEIILVDSLSTDNTLKLAEPYVTRVVSQEFLGYVAQRNFATDQATHDWILMLDADEVVSEDLSKNILQIKSQPHHQVYELGRLTNYCGKWIKHSGWYPDKKIRLYNRTKGKWIGELVHEHWEANTLSESIGSVKGHLLHYTFNTIDEHIRQIHKFTELSAISAAKKGKTCSLFKIWFGPKWYFISRYIFKLGFLDGYYGYLVCKLSAYAQLIKYSKIRAYSKKK